MLSTDLIFQAGIALAYVFIFLILFAESGLFIGFFLPGDSLLVTLGLLASRGGINLTLLILIGCIGAVLGDSVGYFSGKKFGRAIFNKPDSLLFKKEYIDKAEAFYHQHGRKTIVLARFTPVVRTFAPIVAGAAEMPYSEFLTYNVIGGVLWVTVMSLIGFFVGAAVPNVDKYILPIIALIVLASLVPALLHMRKSSSRNA